MSWNSRCPAAHIKRPPTGQMLQWPIPLQMELSSGPFIVANANEELIDAYFVDATTETFLM